MGVQRSKAVVKGPFEHKVASSRFENGRRNKKQHQTFEGQNQSSYFDEIITFGGVFMLSTPQNQSLTDTFSCLIQGNYWRTTRKN